MYTTCVESERSSTTQLLESWYRSDRISSVKELKIQVQNLFSQKRTTSISTQQNTNKLVVVCFLLTQSDLHSRDYFERRVFVWLKREQVRIAYTIFKGELRIMENCEEVVILASLSG